VSQALSLLPKLRGPLVTSWRWTRAKVVPDHSTIHRAAWHNDTGGRNHFYVNVACAPARRHQWTIDVAGAHAWADEALASALNSIRTG